NKDGDTPAHLAAKGLGNALAQELVQAGADLNRTDKNNHTPLEVAFETRYSQAAKAKFDADAVGDVTDFNTQGELIERAARAALDEARDWGEELRAFGDVDNLLSSDDNVKDSVTKVVKDVERPKRLERITAAIKAKDLEAVRKEIDADPTV